mmetsp:Transcript_66427/g.133843  ORF Transcript_66427/g.133843 Transcript_66427/m.133843 type:complete len:253 (+) Transcript_66427:744-1502(+)
MCGGRGNDADDEEREEAEEAVRGHEPPRGGWHPQAHVRVCVARPGRRRGLHVPPRGHNSRRGVRSLRPRPGVAPEGESGASQRLVGARGVQMAEAKLRGFGLRSGGGERVRAGAARPHPRRLEERPLERAGGVLLSAGPAHHGSAGDGDDAGKQGHHAHAPRQTLQRHGRTIQGDGAGGERLVRGGRSKRGRGGIRHGASQVQTALLHGDGVLHGRARPLPEWPRESGVRHSGPAHSQGLVRQGRVGGQQVH